VKKLHFYVTYGAPGKGSLSRQDTSKSPKRGRNEGEESCKQRAGYKDTGAKALRWELPGTFEKQKAG
jgi:hypothetical protein